MKKAYITESEIRKNLEVGMVIYIAKKTKYNVSPIVAVKLMQAVLGALDEKIADFTATAKPE